MIDADISNLFAQARTPRLRTLRQFAEQELVIPDGPYEGRRFNVERQPYTRLWLDAVDSEEWTRILSTGPTQTGKTLIAFILTTMFHLFEVRETVIVGVPDKLMMKDKWESDLLPAIMATRYRDQFPGRGSGSKGGDFERITFKNGAVLRFMKGGGGDKARAGFTSRVVIITETDGMDAPGGVSKEADKIEQFEARQRAFPEPQRRTYLECTASLPGGRTWRELKAGTDSRIVLQCPHCGEWEASANGPEDRELLVGWKDCKSVDEVHEKAAFACRLCGALWTESERADTNRQAKLLHAGQQLNQQTGEIAGEPDKKTTLGFRWSAIHNLFNTAADVAVDEWHAVQAEAAGDDVANHEKKLCQFVWCLPYNATALDMALEPETVKSRLDDLHPRNIVPSDTVALTVGVDLGKYHLHYVVVAWRKQGRGHVVDYGLIEVASKETGVERGLLTALSTIRDSCEAGWPMGGDRKRKPDAVWIDSGWESSTVYRWIRAVPEKERYYACKGHGTGQRVDGYASLYRAPRKSGATVQYVGEGYHIAHLPTERVYLVEVDADQWKCWVQGRFKMDAGNDGSLTLFSSLDKNEHHKLAMHVTAERQVSEYITGRGIVTKLERVRRANHYLDCLYLAAAAGHFRGARLIEEPKAKPDPPRRRMHARALAGMDRPFLVTER